MEHSNTAEAGSQNTLDTTTQKPLLSRSPPPHGNVRTVSPPGYDSDNEPLTTMRARISPSDTTPSGTSNASLSPSDSSAALQLAKTLTKSTVFYDIPRTDAFSDLLDQKTGTSLMDDHERTSSSHDTLVSLVEGKMWRPLARYAKHKLVQTAPEDLESILQLWYIRLLALTKLGLFQIASAELERLGDLDRSEFRHSGDGHSLVPIELWILWARLPASMNHPLIALERLTMLAVHCKKMQLHDEKLWKQREVQVYIVLATQMIEMGDFKSAASTMTMVLDHFAPGNIDVLAALGRLYLQLGDIGTAERLFQRIESLTEENDTPLLTGSIKTNRILLLMAKGEWDKAGEELEQVIEANKDDPASVHNRAVCYVYQGHIAKAIELLENLTLQSQVSAGTCPTVLQNLCVLYELRYANENSTEKKKAVLKRSAHWVGDAFPIDCFRLQ